MIWHNVTLFISDPPDANTWLEIGDRIKTGTGTGTITPHRQRPTICEGVPFGENSVGGCSISEPGVYAGAPARRLKPHREEG